MTTLYRLFDAQDELLYVGISDNWSGRLRQHVKGKPWSPEITRVQLAEFPSRDDALGAEREAILAERPRFNVTHNVQIVARPKRVIKTVKREPPAVLPQLPPSLSPLVTPISEAAALDRVATIVVRALTRERLDRRSTMILSGERMW